MQQDNLTSNEDNQDIHSSGSSDNRTEKKGHPFLIIGLAVVFLFILSLMPWSKWTGDAISDFNLLSDIFPSAAPDTTEYDEISPEIDPELLAIAKEESTQTSDTIAGDTAVRVVVAAAPPRQQGDMIIEDYTPDRSGLSHMKAALARRNSRPVRIGVIGDSYIEGDIFTQDIRRMLQEQYGGCGVGYVPAFSETAGFRRSVHHKASGWTEHDIRKSKTTKFTIAGQHFTGSNDATFTFTGNSKQPLLAGWATSRVLFIAPAEGTIAISNDSEERSFNIKAAPDSVQCIELPGRTSRFSLKSSVPGLTVLGAWLEDINGVVLDNMSLRGDSGTSHRRVSGDLTSQLRQYVDYDLIIMEYGINALSEKQTEYSAYRKVMTRVARHLKSCYPNADIVLLGIGDRGVKKNGQIQSIPTAPAMVAAQRDAARDAGVLFWDTREAMGGEGAVISWRQQKLVNGDYIHLNSNGGARLAEEFVASLNRKLSE